VIISVGPDSKHDHPHEDMLDIYNDQVGAENVPQTSVEGVCASKSCSLRGHVHPSCRSDVRAIQPGVACGLCRNSTALAPLAGDRDVDTFTGVFWSDLHGLATLSRAGRLRPEFYDQRMAMLVDQFSRHRDEVARHARLPRGRPAHRQIRVARRISSVPKRLQIAEDTQPKGANMTIANNSPHERTR